MTVQLRDIEQEVARRAAPFEIHTGALGGTATAVVATDLVSSADAGNPYTGQWILRRSANANDRQRRIVDPYTPATGTMTVDRPYAVPVAEGEEFEVTPLDPARHLRRAVLAGLARCFFVDRATVPVTAGRVEEDLSAALFWITDVGQIRDIESRVGTAGVARPAPLDWYRPFSSTSGVSVGVLGPTAGVYLVEALRPHATWVNGADAPSGPVNDADTLAVPLEYAAAAGHVELWRYARQVLAPVASGPQRLAAPLSEATATFNTVVRQQWWFWSRPDWVTFRYPSDRAGGDQWMTGHTWRSWEPYTWRGLEPLTWAQVLGG